MIAKKDAGEEVQVAALEAGAYFGEMSLLTGEKRSATIQALSETTVLAITRENLKALLAADPTAADTISRVIAERSLQTQKELAAKRERILEDAGAVKEAAKALDDPEEHHLRQGPWQTGDLPRPRAGRTGVVRGCVLLRTSYNRGRCRPFPPGRVRARRWSVP